MRIDTKEAKRLFKWMEKIEESSKAEAYEYNQSHLIFSRKFCYEMAWNGLKKELKRIGSAKHSKAKTEESE